MLTNRLSATIALFFALLLFASATNAQNPPLEHPTADDSCEVINGIAECGTDKLDGEIDRPEAFYVLQPTNLTFEHQRSAVSFLPELLRTVTDGPL